MDYRGLFCPLSERSEFWKQVESRGDCTVTGRAGGWNRLPGQGLASLVQQQLRSQP